MKNAIATVIRGFLLGVGFSVAAIGATLVAQVYFMSQYQQYRTRRVIGGR